MIKLIIQKINSLIGSSDGYDGYKGFIFINLGILVLVLVLIFVQQKWISREREALKSVIENKKKLENNEKNESQKDSKKIGKKKVLERKKRLMYLQIFFVQKIN
ncbi:MAG: hypothetical protein SCARUB_01943 [Candidatus Scalindua rubra]|uniref:Uncharacterized protein n=1 Tax=Candidatus Scalindua rubra TaxID=1872076 RepID=A0A1E3XBE1_9BACT|nr:MAG: hypothetical protein SCARUB_01943 [Candidatus Scalindua rubra]